MSRSPRDYFFKKKKKKLKTKGRAMRGEKKKKDKL